MEKSLLILGAGEYGEVVKEIAEDIGTYSRIEFLDDNLDDVLGRLEDHVLFKNEFTDAIVAIDDPFIRMRYTDKLKECDFHIPVLIHPTAYVSKSAKLGAGTVVQPLAVVHTAVRMGISCIVSVGAAVNHHSTVGDGVNLGANSTIICNSIVPAGTRTVSGQLYTAEISLRNTNAWMTNYSFDDGV